jgi:hypothetical protein
MKMIFIGGLFITGIVLGPFTVATYNNIQDLKDKEYAPKDYVWP